MLEVERSGQIWIFFPKENKKDSRSVVRSERKGNGRLELLLTKTGGLWSRGRGELALDLRFLLEELGER